MKNIEQFVFITTIDIHKEFQEDWEILTDFDGNPFTSIDEAKEFVRLTIGKFKKVGLANFNQMKMSNAQWNNL